MADGPVFARVHVLVLCDAIAEHPDEQGVFDLRGVRTQLRARSFPHTHPQLYVYLQLTGHEGTVSGHVAARSEATEEEVVYRPIDALQLVGPLTVVHVWLRIRNCIFPGPGVYWFQVVLNEKLVAERRFVVSEIPGGTNGQPTP
jgi:hypothetical protein